MEPLALKDREQFPDTATLENALKAVYPAFTALVATLAGLGIAAEWNYYNDGHAWLCKLLHKKKNLGWLHVYEGFFTLTCFFTAKHLPAIDNLPVDPALKEAFYRREPTGKLLPFTVPFNGEERLSDALALIRFKQSLK